MLEQVQDNALIRFSLGNAYLNSKDYKQVIKHLALALRHDPDYSAVWKLYCKALASTRNNNEAIKAY
jgi:Tfp pilus assembly protein PilF